MNSLITSSTTVQTMTSREIADLLEKQHANIKISAERLAEKGVIGTLAVQEFTHNGNIYTEYLLNKRDSLILVAQNCPEFTARIVDRWQELEAKEQAFDPASLSRMDILKLAMQTEEERLKLEQEKRHLEQQIETEAPRVAFAKQVEIAPDAISVAQAAKILGTGQQRLFAFLREIGWVTRYNEPYQEKIEAGLLDVKLGSWQHPDHGLKQSVTSLITGKGLAKLQPLWEKHKGRAA